MLSILFKTLGIVLVHFYTISFQATDGSTISMNSFQGKKVLLVNAGTTMTEASQLAELQELQQAYADSLVVIVFPSNSFGHESRTDTQIKEFCQSAFGATFIIAAKSDVKGANINSVYAWLADINKNGEMNGSVGADYQKFLVNSDGMLIGSFSSKIRPNDPKLIQAITNPF